MKSPTTTRIPKESKAPADVWNISHPFGHHPLRMHAHLATSVVEQLPPAVLFLHGYKGYAEWGCWNLMADELAQSGISCFRLDFSGNGTTTDCPDAIVDLAAWSENNYTQEVRDALAAMREIVKAGMRVVLMGHSRGGGIATIAAATSKNTRFSCSGLILMASVSDFGARFPKQENLQAWEKTNRFEVQNQRTGETYHHQYSFYEDYLRHRRLLEIRRQAKRIECPVFLTHAEDDLAVSIEESKILENCLVQSRNVITQWLPGGGHVFGMREPWPKSRSMPKEMADLVLEIGHFVKCHC